MLLLNSKPKWVEERELFITKHAGINYVSSKDIIVSVERYSQDDRLIPCYDRKFLTHFKNLCYNNGTHNDKDVNKVYWSEAMRR